MKSKVFSIILLLGLFGGLIFGFFYHQNHCDVCLSLKSFSAESIRHFIQSFGPLAIFVYVLLYSANTFSPFFPPIFIMSLAAGAIFGPVWGTLALTLATFSGTSSAFFAARYIGRTQVEKLMRGKGEALYDKLSTNGFFILLPMRLIGFPPYGIIDFICGLSKMRYRDFAAATMIGAAPWIITQVLLADRFANFNPKDPVLWGLLAAFICMIVITGKIIKKKEAVQKASS